MGLRPTSGLGRIEFKAGGLLWRMPGRTRGGGTVALVCASESGTATLCGMSEYISPSTPPKKYRTETPSGYMEYCYRVECGNASDGGPGAWSYYGTRTYDPDTCAVTNTQTQQNYTSAGGCAVTTSSTTAWNFNPFVPDGIIQDTTVSTLSEGQASRTWDANGCVTTGAYNKIKFIGSITATLTDEDTEDDAIARATGTTLGESCTAYKETRGAADFTFLFSVVAYELNCAGLTAGKGYRITYTLTTATYGGGSPSSATQSVDFVASGTTHTVADTLDCDSGQQVTISGPRISQL